ncbi:DUF3927 family protein [Enterobacter hormaechei]|uniref:DUF3927 family protein n=1 Tax=Enterobacter hormaechei TaxID=158836 RepID=UPI0032B0BF45
MIEKLRWVAAGVLLFLVVAINFTSKMMSISADGVLVIGRLINSGPCLNPVNNTVQKVISDGL